MNACAHASTAWCVSARSPSSPPPPAPATQSARSLAQSWSGSASHPRNGYLASLLASLVYTDNAGTFCGKVAQWGVTGGCT